LIRFKSVETEQIGKVV